MAGMNGVKTVRDLFCSLCTHSFTNLLKGGINMKLRIVLEPSDEGGYTVFVPSLPGCFSEGDTKEEAQNNIKEAIELYLEPIDDDMNFGENVEILELAV